jgi:glutathione synthase/RimK-type ligase-like ATP-grasp enzyme
MPRVLLLATTTGYQTRAFAAAAEQANVEILYATDRCDVLDDPWRDGAVPVRFHDEAWSVAALLDAVRTRPVNGVLVVGDRPTVIAASVAEALGLPAHSPDSARVARNKLATRERLSTAGMKVPWFRVVDLKTDARALARQLDYPCVVKPLALSGSRGVIRADTP